MKAAFFDLDDTIIEGSTNQLFFKWCLDKKIYSWPDVLTAGLSGIIYKMGIIDPLNLVYFWLRRHKGFDDSAFNDLMQACFEDVIKTKIRPKAAEEIKKQRSDMGANGKLVLLSASTQYICEIMGNHLQLDDVLCTRLAIKESKISGELEGPFLYGENKAIAALEYCEKNKIDIKECHYYGDAYTDRFVLGAVGHPHCISPDAGLRKYAHENGWVIRDWRMTPTPNR